MCQLSSLKTSPGLVSLPGSVQLLHKITNAKTVGAVGINQFKILVTGSIDMWRHPKYYKELRKLRNKSDQAISQLAEPVAGRRAPGQGHKRQAIEESVPHNDIEEAQASSSKRQAVSSEDQASSSKSSKL